MQRFNIVDSNGANTNTKAATDTTREGALCWPCLMKQCNNNKTDKRWMFVCVEVFRPSQPNGVMSSAVSLPNHMFTGQA